MDATAFLRLLLDPKRLAILGLVATRARTSAELMTETGQRHKAVLTTLAPLVQAGIVVHDGRQYTLRREALRELAHDLPKPPPPDPEVFYGTTEDEQVVLARFFRGTQLVGVPTKRAKRLVVLERIALDFEPGHRYPSVR